MATKIVPRSSGLTFYSIFELGEFVYRFDFNWNTRGEDWRMDVTDTSDGSVVLSSMRVSPGKVFLRFEDGSNVACYGPDPYPVSAFEEGLISFEYVTGEELEELRAQLPSYVPDMELM
jgi:hypothetical protein